MQWRTHIFCGLNSLWPLAAVPRLVTADHLPLLIAASAFGALLPDLDAAESKIKHLQIARIKPFLLPSVAIHRQFGHRKFFHSFRALLLITAVSLPFSYWLGWEVPAGLVLGYASHLAADACTRSGIPFFYPNLHRYHLLPARFRFVTGSLAEEALLPLLCMAFLLFLMMRLSALLS